MRRRRPARRLEEPSDEERKRLGGPVPRQLYRTGGSLVVAVPSHICEYLDARVGMQLWWWVGAGREAIVSMSARRLGGRPAGLHAARELTAARAEIDRLKRRLAARPEAVYHEGVNEGRMRHMGELVSLGVKLDELTARVDELAARLPFGRRRHGRTEQRPSPAAAPSRSVEEVHLPEPEEPDPPYADDFDSHGRVIPRAGDASPPVAQDGTFRGDTEIAPPS